MSGNAANRQELLAAEDLLDARVGDSRRLSYGAVGMARPHGFPNRYTPGRLSLLSPAGSSEQQSQAGRFLRHLTDPERIGDEVLPAASECRAEMGGERGCVLAVTEVAEATEAPHDSPAISEIGHVARILASVGVVK